MRNFYLPAGFLSIVLVLTLNLAAVAQRSTSSAPQHDPSMSAPTQSAPGQGAPGQEGPGAQATPGNSAQGQADENNPLNLTEDQKARLRPILIEENQQLEAVRNDTTMKQEEKIAKANEIRQTASPKIRAVLTPEQLQKLNALQQKANHQQNQNAPKDAVPPQK